MRYVRFTAAIVWIGAIIAMGVLQRPNPWRNVAAAIALTPVVIVTLTVILWGIWLLTADSGKSDI